jgi:integrase
VARNVADLVDPPRPQRKEMAALTAEQVRAFLDVAANDRFFALYCLAVGTGMRQAEMLGLTWSAVDLDRGVLAVQQQLVRVRGVGLTFSEPKTSKARRSITLPAFAVEALKWHRKAQLAEHLAMGPKWTDLHLVFANEIGKPLERSNLVRRSFEPLLARAGLPRIRFHDLRHTAATLLLSQGTHPKVVQERLGHATIAMTLDVYSHVVPSMQRDAATQLDGLIGRSNAV